MRKALLSAALAGALLVTAAGCDLLKPDTFANGTYTGLLDQELVISGDEFSCTLPVAGITVSGNYAINGKEVTFTTTKIGGQNTGIQQKTTFDVTYTLVSISLTNARNLVNGGCGIAPDTFTKR